MSCYTVLEQLPTPCCLSLLLLSEVKRLTGRCLTPTGSCFNLELCHFFTYIRYIANVIVIYLQVVVNAEMNTFDCINCCKVAHNCQFLRLCRLFFAEIANELSLPYLTILMCIHVPTFDYFSGFSTFLLYTKK